MSVNGDAVGANISNETCRTSSFFFGTTAGYAYGELRDRIASGMTELPLVVLPLASMMMALMMMTMVWVSRQRQRLLRKHHIGAPPTPTKRHRSQNPSRQLGCRHEAALARKREFLSREGETYGYKGTPGGWIDDWRSKEFPKLQRPYSNNNSTNDNDEREIYLDYAGSALPTQSQLEKLSSSAAIILANPHSTGPAASRTLLGIQHAQQRILTHLDALPGRFASFKHPPPFASIAQCHPGYDIVFTSGTTEALRLIAERFPWQPQCPQCGRQSIFLYAHNSHTSVVGMRELAIDQGARFLCRDLEDIATMTKDDFSNCCLEAAAQRSTTTTTTTMLDCKHCLNTNYPHLLAFPAECNFGGTRPHTISAMVAAARASGFYTLLDLAKAASTGPVHLRDADPDFSCLSFYKLFGTPTGLGALLVKRTSIPILFEQQRQRRRRRRHYVGGGSVQIMVPHNDFCVARSEPSPLASLTNGSLHFRGILALQHGFDELDRVGGMSRIHQHSTCLARELARRLQSLRHNANANGNGRPVVVIYGAWKDPVESASSSAAPGPTVALNVQREDGSFVGYNEVSKLANSSIHPPIQFRTGCFCNPGACQQALGLTDAQAIDNFETAGHVCGDHIDLVHGQPTGAIRISFGKDSLWEDLDAFVVFIETTFVSRMTSCERFTTTRTTTTPLSSRSPTKVELSELYLFPIKSCSAQRVSRWRIELPSGKLMHDREFALVDTSGTAMRLQTCPKMGMIVPSIDLPNQTMTISAPGRDDLVVDLAVAKYHDDSGHNTIVKVCGNKCGGRLWGEYAVSEWFSSFLGVQCWLARFSNNNGEYQMPQQHHQYIDRANANGSPLVLHHPRVGFANEQPILLISENAVAALNQVLEEQHQTLVGSRHFRPNLVVKSIRDDDGCHIEDEWKTLTLTRLTPNATLRFEVKGSCARCTMIDYDPMTGKKGKTLRALAKYRRRNGQITFGIFLRAMAEDSDNKEIWIEEGDDLLCT